MDCCEHDSLLDRFREQHARERSRATSKLERAVLGQEVGLNGYTTLGQAEALSHLLGASSDDRVLEVGAGRGWPGWYVARISSCRVVAIDIPLDAMIAARNRFARDLPPGLGKVVVADGLMLGIRGASIDGVIHSDMLCCVLEKLSVLRECYRVLKPGGRMVGYLIHTPPGLSVSAQERAERLGPTAVNADHSPVELASMAGFTVVDTVDVTERFRETVSAMIRVRIALEEDLRLEEGDAVYEEELQDEQNMFRGIDEGLLLRSRLVTAKGT